MYIYIIHCCNKTVAMIPVSCHVISFFIGNFRNLVDICLPMFISIFKTPFKTPVQAYIQINELHQSRLLKQHFGVNFWPSPRCYLTASVMRCNQLFPSSVRASERQPSHSGTSEPLTLVSDENCWNIVTSLIASFMGPTWGPSGADRTQMGPMLVL